MTMANRETNCAWDKCFFSDFFWKNNSETPTHYPTKPQTTTQTSISSSRRSSLSSNIEYHCGIIQTSAIWIGNFCEHSKSWRVWRKSIFLKSHRSLSWYPRIKSSSIGNYDAHFQSDSWIVSSVQHKRKCFPMFKIQSSAFLSFVSR